MTPQSFPVLFLDDEVVLPGMVVPVELTDQAQASLDAARAARDARSAARDPLRLLLVPRIDGRSGAMGVVAGVMAPAAALWVEAEPLDEPAPTPHGRELAGEFKGLLTSILQQRGAWQ